MNASESRALLESASFKSPAHQACVRNLPWRAITIAAVVAATSLAPTSIQAAYIIENRPGGLNFDEYSDAANWNNTSNKSTAEGLTPGIGSRVVSTYVSGVGEQHAYFKPELPDTGLYEVFTTWGAFTNRRNPILFTITHANGITEVDVDQTATYNEWISLGQFVFNSGPGTVVDMSNLHIDETGVMTADAVKWELLQVIVIPEPSTGVLLGIGFAGLFLPKRRR